MYFVIRLIGAGYRRDVHMAVVSYVCDDTIDPISDNTHTLK